MTECTVPRGTDVAITLRAMKRLELAWRQVLLERDHLRTEIRRLEVENSRLNDYLETHWSE